MSTVTIEAAQKRLDKAQKSAEEAQAGVAEALAILEQVKSLGLAKVLTISAASIDLKPGEHYAGMVLNADGTLKHHLVLMAAKPGKELTWNDAKAWAASVGGELPTRQEQALLFANCKPHLEAAWHWSCEEYETNASYAWFCNFLNGSQNGALKSSTCSAVAVRRLNP